jgi:hypothetical protein
MTPEDPDTPGPDDEPITGPPPADHESDEDD